MFMQIAVGAIGIAVILMVGYIVVSQVRTAVSGSTPQAQYANSCQGYPINDTTFCNTTAVNCGPLTDNTSAYVTCDNAEFLAGASTTQVTIFAGFGLVAVGIIVLAAFGMINVFK